MNISEVSLLIIFMCISNICAQHIFDSLKTTCSYKMIEKNATKPGKKLKSEEFTFYSYDFQVENKKLEVRLNLCGSLGTFKGCKPGSVACVLKKGKSFVSNAGTNFSLGIDEEDNSMLLKSFGGDRCTDDEGEIGPYSVYINFDEGSNAKAQPRIKNTDDCAVRIGIPHPKRTPLCTARSRSKLFFDLQPLRKLDDLTVNSTQGTYALSICKLAVACDGANSVGCLLKGGGTSVVEIGTLDRQQVYYDDLTNVLSIRSSVNRSKKRLIIFLKCNWDVELSKPVKLPKDYQFEVESKYGCVKVPFNCSVMDDHGYVFNLNGLNRPTGWRVGNITQGNMLLNVCGRLEMDSRNLCSKYFSQVCFIQGNKNLNYGSTYTSIVATKDNLQLQLEHGSVCPTNGTKLLRTEVTFYCSATELGPVFKGVVNCTSTIIWQTPKACPVYRRGETTSLETMKQTADNLKYSDCTVYQDNLMYNLTNLMLSQRNYVLRKDNSLYVINVCRPLVLDETNRYCSIGGACIINSTVMDIRYKFIKVDSFNRPELLENELVLRYVGGMCHLGKSREILIRFQCSQRKEPLKFVRADKCLHEFLWETPEACSKKAPKLRSVKKCNITNGTEHVIFDFSATSHEDVRVTIANIKYNFSICSDLYSVEGPDNTTVTVNAQTTLRKVDCKYVKEFQLGNNTECKENSYLRIIFTCNTLEDKEYFRQVGTNNCTTTLEYVTAQVCRSISPECDNRHLVNRKSEEDSTLKAVVTKLESTTKEIQQSPITKETIQHLRPNCSLTMDDGRSFKLSQLRSFQIANESTYYIGPDHMECNDFICKQNYALSAMKDSCPGVTWDMENSQVKLHFSGPKCKHSQRETDLIYDCTGSTEISRITKESKCGLEIIAYDPLFCTALFTKKSSRPEQVGYIVGIVLLMVVLISGSIFLFVMKYKRPDYIKCRNLAD